MADREREQALEYLKGEAIDVYWDDTIERWIAVSGPFEGAAVDPQTAVRNLLVEVMHSAPTTDPPAPPPLTPANVRTHYVRKGI